MSTNPFPTQVRSYNVWLDGELQAKSVKSISWPKLKLKTQEVRSGDMNSPESIPTGQEKMELKIVFYGVCRKAYEMFGAEQLHTVIVRETEAQQNEDPKVTITTMRVKVVGVEASDTEHDKVTETSVDMEVLSHKKTFSNGANIDIDVHAGTMSTGGKDLVGARTLLGQL